ncbi:hypothetical protein C8C83_5620 [Flavobacterium sp. 90]|uniref:hypothetical protein n=1 Tax=unclassified Flavobacterium TaxID=196869 RepID=UPI000EB3A96B|nr:MULTISPECIES: hypothetical protein [unclassified Flavobacterium]RKR08382.1 hypothetical protein C8C82_0251 [Flavobacterium sp. 81]TCK57570.1 hypothetical protein C8C83_5620 [Flavobacterium sp. 90]
MKKLSFILFAICLTLGSCSSDEKESTQKEDLAMLDNMRNEIIQFTQVNSQACNNAQEWGFIKIDAAGCSGNGGYILYSKKVSAATLQNKIEEYNKTKGEIYTKWGIFVDYCAGTTAPTGVKCVNEKPVLSFDNIIFN